jgi:hypothetical protein
VYYLYSQYGFDKGDIGRLFIAGFGSSMLFGTIVGSLADKQCVRPPSSPRWMIRVDFVVVVVSQGAEVDGFFGGQGAEEGVHYLLHHLHPELLHQAFSPVQDSDDWACARRHRHVAALLSIRVVARRGAQQGISPDPSLHSGIDTLEMAWDLSVSILTSSFGSVYI